MRRTMMTVIPLLLLSATPAHAQRQAGWRVSEVSGDVRISEGGRSRAATRGALLASGSTITAGGRARAVLVRGQQYVTVSPNTQLRVAEPQAQQSRGFIQIITDWGSALFRVDRREAPHFGVQTPYLAAVVRGTTFTVTVGPSGASVQVTEGAVEVSTLDGGASDMVRPGMIASVGASDLFQLTINGDQERVIRSRNAPAGGAVTVPAPAQPASSAAVSITQAVGEPSVDLADATRGLVRGEPSLELAVLRPSVTGNAAPPPQAAQPTPPPPQSEVPAPPPVSDTPPPPASDPGPPPGSESPPPPSTGPGDEVGDPGSGDDQGDHNGDGHPDNGDNGHGPDGDHNGDGHPDNGDNGHGPDGDHNGDGHPDNGDNGSRPDRDRGPPNGPRGRPD